MVNINDLIIKIEPTDETEQISVPQNIQIKDEPVENLREKIWEFQNDFEYIENTVIFTCQICHADICPSYGIILKNCLHEFCKKCLSQHIEHSQESEVSCPYVSDGNQRCEGFLDDREVRNLVTEEIYLKHLEKSIKGAEISTQNSFHCRKLNCPGWVEIVGRFLKTFECPVCKSLNCVKCQAVHGRMTCWQFKAKTMQKSDDVSSSNYIKDLIRDKRAMRCSKCGIVIQKTYGCNHMTCSNCKNEFTWTGIN